MLNKDNQRELAYVVVIDKITPIEGADRVALAHVGGWTVMVGKDEFEAGDPAVYFEIDSKVPETERFKFLEKKHYKIKTQKYFKGTVISQGLLMPAAAFNWKIESAQFAGGFSYLVDEDGNQHIPEDKDTMFLTKQLGVTYAVDDDNKRKGASVDKYKKMAARHPKLFQNPIIKKIYKTDLGKKILFIFFGKKRDKKGGWPSHIASKTDVERIQNAMYILKDKNPYVATEKIDGSSCSIMAERKKFGKIKYYICSRNVVFEDEEQKCFYDNNIYFEAYYKYNFKDKITQILNDYNLNNVALQMEVFGPTVQKRNYSLDERQAMVFHIVSNGIKFSMDQVVEICEKYDIPHVPIIDDNFIMPDTIEELQTYVEGEGSRIDGKPREGIVFYDKQTGQQYVKFVSPNFLLTYHG